MTDDLTPEGEATQIAREYAAKVEEDLLYLLFDRIPAVVKREVEKTSSIPLNKVKVSLAVKTFGPPMHDAPVVQLKRFRSTWDIPLHLIIHDACDDVTLDDEERRIIADALARSARQIMPQGEAHDALQEALTLMDRAESASAWYADRAILFAGYARMQQGFFYRLQRRTRTVLAQHQICTLEELQQETEESLLALGKVGRSTIADIQRALETEGLPPLKNKNGT